MDRRSYSTDKDDLAVRLDIFVSIKAELSRSHAQKLIKSGMVRVNSLQERPGYRLKSTDIIELDFPDTPETTLIPEDIPLNVTYEDNDLVVVNKPPGMVIYPAAGHSGGTLLNAMIGRYGELAPTGSPLRSGVVHRLDKDTSGLIIFARTDRAYLNLVKQFRERNVEKIYKAIVYGILVKDSGMIDFVIGRAISDRKKMSIRTKKGKHAVTKFRVLKRFSTASLIEVQIITGRTHQIRVHFAAAGHPVLGDKTYGNKTVIQSGQRSIHFRRQMLHACGLRFVHPVTGKQVSLNAPLPEDMKKAIEDLRE